LSSLRKPMIADPPPHTERPRLCAMQADAA
jgi:hypothetical protein